MNPPAKLPIPTSAEKDAAAQLLVLLQGDRDHLRLQKRLVEEDLHRIGAALPNATPEAGAQLRAERADNGRIMRLIDDHLRRLHRETTDLHRFRTHFLSQFFMDCAQEYLHPDLFAEVRARAVAAQSGTIERSRLLIADPNNAPHLHPS